MDETEGDSRYLSNYGTNQGYRKQVSENYVEEEDDEVEEEEQEQEVDANDNENETNGAIQHNVDDDDDEDDDNDEDDDEKHNRNDNFNLHRHPKKRKLKSLLSSFEFAPRVPPSTPPTNISNTKPSFGGRNTLTDWSEHETFVLLEAWGERFLQRGRKSLRSEEWQEVSEKVSQESKIERTDTQCRNRLDTLKKKYKKEKASLQGNNNIRNANPKWVYFKKMDMLMSSTPHQTGLSCGVDSGEYVFMNPTVYLNHANGLDEMRDSPGNTESLDDDDDDDLLPRKKLKNKKDNSNVNVGSFKLLADSINKFSDIYEKIENGKRKQMVELEKLRMDFHKELEIQKREILERARDEIAKIRQGGFSRE